MTIISPSLLSCNFLKLEEELLAFSKIDNIWFHLDIMDAHFVPNLTFGHPLLKQITKATDKPLDAHLMVTHPDFFVDQFQDLGLHNLTFHWEAEVHHDRLIQKIKKLYPSVGISLNPSTPTHLIPDYLLQEIDLVLLMSVNPGFGGQSFIPSVLQKVTELNQRKDKLGASFEIQVDGGVNEHNAPILRQSGATNLVAGSFIFKGNYREQINALLH